MTASALALCLVLVGLSRSIVEGSAFLRPRAGFESEETARQRVVVGLLAELSKVDDPLRLQELEEELRPLFVALPKDAEGKLEAPTVRYALHRHFAQWRGWHMKGLEYDFNENSTSPLGIVEIFGQGKGTDLSKLALIVSKLTDVVHEEAERNLRNVFSGLGLPTDGMVSRKDAEYALQRYLVMYLLGDSTDGVTRDDLLEAERGLIDVYPAWRSVKMWSKDLDQTLQLTQRSKRNPFIGGQVPFDHSLSTVQELGHRFSSFQNFECRSLKSALMDIEFSGSGRVLLSDFYRVGLKTDWQFNENVAYLRSLGALDDSDPNRLRVFIPNYLHSPTNCLSASGFYSVCCFNECEGLLRSLESQIKGPSALPRDILQEVALIESDTVAAPRNLSSTLQLRLSAIGDLHGGRVPLHGRLFAQWMHHAYPRECPFPHVSGNTRPRSQEEWVREIGVDGLASKEEMQSMSLQQQEAMDHDAIPLPWIEMEELVAPSQQVGMKASYSLQRSMLLIAFAMSVLIPLSLGMKTVRVDEFGSERFLV